MSAPDSLQRIAEEISACTRCALHKTRTRAVPGEGPQNAEIMLIGEGPGFNEDQQGRPFVGQAGQFLEQLLALAGLKRSDVWIGNVVKCRPPNNRDPMPEELQACHAYLERQIAVINPKIIVTLGRFSMGKFFPTARISAIHGQMRRVGDRFVIAMFHPAAALHNPTYLPLIKQDFAQLPQLLETARRELAKTAPAPAPAPTPRDETPKQMRLF